MGMYRENFTVRYSEVDSNNEITPISIMQYFQEIGCLHSDYVQFGLNQNAAWVIIQWKVRILSKVKWHENIMVRTWPSSMKGPFCMRDYEMYCGEKLIAAGTSKWVLTDMQTHKILKITDEIIEKFQVVDKQVFNGQWAKLEPFEGFGKTITHIVTKHDLDTNHHMNNIKYIELAYSLINKDVKDIEVFYKRAAVLGDKIVCSVKENKVVMKIEGNLAAIVSFK